MSQSNFVIADLPYSQSDNFLESLTVEEQKVVAGGSAIAFALFANNDAISGTGGGISGPTQIRKIDVIAAPGFARTSIVSRFSPRRFR